MTKCELNHDRTELGGLIFNYPGFDTTLLSCLSLR
jgi:hypothetical protein